MLNYLIKWDFNLLWNKSLKMFLKSALDVVCGAIKNVSRNKLWNCVEGSICDGGNSLLGRLRVMPSEHQATLYLRRGSPAVKLGRV